MVRRILVFAPGDVPDEDWVTIVSTVLRWNVSLEILAPNGEARFGIMMPMGVAGQARCIVSWIENNETIENVQTLRFY